MRLVPDERDNHAIEVEEEHQEVKSEFDERFLVRVRLTVDLGETGERTFL